uniref:E3 ubiquitin-protein ligase RNF181 n=1 Tax=Hucho hucho TaxID=62062 RepID=A0A4W5RGD6_9TELE
MYRHLMPGPTSAEVVTDLSDWDQHLPTPTAKTVVQTLPVVVISPEQADKGLKCHVCLLEFEEQETVREMPCKHLFHSGCILPWLRKVRAWPLNHTHTDQFCRF